MTAVDYYLNEVAGSTVGGREKIVLAYGRSYEWRPLPDFIDPAPHGRCFQNAYELVRLDEMLDGDDNLVYVEGFAACHPVDSPVHHAWAARPDGTVIDPTWHDLARDGADYFGVPFKLSYVESRLLDVGMYAVLRLGMTFDPESIQASKVPS